MWSEIVKNTEFLMRAKRTKALANKPLYAIGHVFCAVRFLYAKHKNALEWCGRIRLSRGFG